MTGVQTCALPIWLDEEISGNGDFTNAAEAWTARGIEEAVRCILDGQIPLFESMIRHLEELSADERHASTARVPEAVGAL